MRFDALARDLLALPARLGVSRLIAVDGPSGAGKSYFAGRLARAVVGCGAGAEVVHTDDLLDGWDDQLAFWPRLEECVLKPLRAGEAGGFHPYDWHAGGWSANWTPVAAAPVVIIEGVSTARAGVRADLTLAVFVTAPRAVRERRAVERDGSGLAPHMERWRVVEDEFFARERTASHAGLVVDGAPAGTAHDPDTEFVVLGSGQLF